MTNKKPKVSVCVVTYNQENYIRQCLQSIVDQVTDFAFEVIVADDYSTDSTRLIIQEFVDKYPGMVKPIFHKSNMGPYKNFVFVHQQAIGEHVAHLDGDDLMLPSKLQKQSNFLDLNHECTVVWHRVNFFDDYGKSLSGQHYNYSIFPCGIVDFGTALRHGSVAVHSSIMYRKSSRITNYPNFDTLDLFYSWEYLSGGWGKILDEVLGSYRVNSVGAISVKSELLVRSLVAHHAAYFLKLHPDHRKDVFFFALTNFLIDFKNLRKTAFLFLTLIIASFSLIGPREFLMHLNVARQLRLPKLSEKISTI